MGRRKNDAAGTGCDGGSQPLLAPGLVLRDGDESVLVELDVAAVADKADRREDEEEPREEIYRVVVLLELIKVLL